MIYYNSCQFSKSLAIEYQNHKEKIPIAALIPLTTFLSTNVAVLLEKNLKFPDALKKILAVLIADKLNMEDIEIKVISPIVETTRAKGYNKQGTCIAEAMNNIGRLFRGDTAFFLKNFPNVLQENNVEFLNRYMKLAKIITTQHIKKIGDNLEKYICGVNKRKSDHLESHSLNKKQAIQRENPYKLFNDGSPPEITPLKPHSSGNF